MHWPFLQTSKSYTQSLLFHTSCLHSSAQIKPWVPFIGDLRKETILEKQVLEVLVMSSSCTKDLGKFMDKLIIHILFFIALELNIVDKGKKKQYAIHVG
jgi:hypothetical protein